MTTREAEIHFPEAHRLVGMLVDREIGQSLVREPSRDVGWVEIVADACMRKVSGEGEAAIEMCATLRKDYPLSLHGVSLSIGSVDPLRLDYIGALRDLKHRLDPFAISDHLCFTGIDGKSTGELLPIPCTEEALDHVVSRVDRVQDLLGCRIALENPPSYLMYADEEMTQPEFFRELVARSGCGMLLDVSNLYVMACNNDVSARDYVAQLPAEGVVQYHLAGWEQRPTHLADTHSRPIADPVMELFQDVLSVVGPRPTVVEWDVRGIYETIVTEVRKVHQAVESFSREPLC